MAVKDQETPKIKEKIVSSEDICVCCGNPVPEGRQVCWACENRWKVKYEDTDHER